MAKNKLEEELKKQQKALLSGAVVSDEDAAALKAEGYGEAASFTFTGTGFEIIGRTNAKNSGTIMVQVKDENGTLIKSIPVITEYDNYDNEGDEEIYQVPVIRVTDLSTVAQTYTVSIMGFPARDYDNPDENGVPPIKPSYLYIDGIRIYQPVEGITENSTVLEDYYIDTEKDAVFTEVRNEIVKGNIGTVSYNSTDGISFSTARRSRSRARSSSVVSKVISTSPFFTVSPGCTRISVMLWVSERNTVWTRSVETGP